ncbi:response regulator transcription factor [soil metagenome]
MSDARGLILVAEDERSIAELERVYLRKAGYGVHVETDGLAALAAIIRLRPSLVILDVGLPGMDGVEVCRRMRAADDWTPVVFVTAQGDEVDRVIGIELGADDYITKPFSPRELVARVGGILRRSRHGEAAGTNAAITFDLISLDPLRRVVTVDGAPIAFTVKEFDLLHALLSRPGQVITRAQLLSTVWGHADYVTSRTVDVHVAQVRAKLGDASPLRTVRGVGYAAGD